ncbi:hypothetical protein CCHR01_09959 [Colletotrichum chrysophilum]|uniref:Ankyrin repeat protein n=1 Tax=Colletotrichum chrysophilum TaxID=1836956 RepID=A0AAD9AFV6_9PEZI|nr:hypothetical protein CCHR01_09959 [Colletotrichum chrysophilum]
MANTNIPVPVGSAADNDEAVSPEAAGPTGDNISHGASVLRKFIEDLERSEEGAREVGMFRYWIDSMVDDGIQEGLDMKDRHGRTLLNVAAIQGLAETAKRLIEAGAVLDVQDEWGDTPLIDACGEGDGEGNYFKVVKLLLEKGATADIFGNENESALYRASINGHHRIVQYLLAEVEWNLDVGEETSDMTPLHAAAVSDNSEIVRYLRDKGAKLDRCDTDGWTPLMTAIDSQSKDALKELLQRRNDEDIQLEKADSEGRTPILRAAEKGFWDGFRLLMEAGAGWTEAQSETTEATERNSASAMSSWSAIELAAYARDPRVLWLLIASSPQSKETKEALKSAKDIVSDSKFKRHGQVDDTKKRNKQGSTSGQEVQDIINNPPTGLIFTDSRNYSLPRHDDNPSSLENYEATIVQFFKRGDKFDSIIRSQSVKETIYSQGPTDIMTDVVDKLKDLSTSHMGKWEGSSLIQRPNSTGPKPMPEFTWIHLPATNMVWMDMPYLSYAFQYGGGINDKENDEVNPMSFETEEQPENRLATTEELTTHCTAGDVIGLETKKDYEHEYDEESNYAKRLLKTQDTYQVLLDEYKGKIIHGSSTLDESYYHFGDDPGSIEDRMRRNKTQVVTEIWRKKRLGSYWLLIRVNQLWIWTINNRWLISASSHPIDDGENELLNDVLDRLEKDREAGGSILQQASTAEMSQLIVDFCVDSYERKPKVHDSNRPEACRLKDFPSIRQAFSKSINSIARDETNLFDQFSRLREQLREISGQSTSKYSKPERKTLLDKELAEATSRAEDLSCRVKDILDELSILESTVQYQQDVQKAMRKKGTKKEKEKRETAEMDLTATYVINDIKRLNSVAERVLAAVNTTLSLHQSEVANLQAKLSVEHAELATKQGRVLMVFTVVTILFLPMSFLTSLFALDVASFEQAPAWALIVIFSVSIGLFIPAVLFAFAWDQSKQVTSKLLSKLLGPAIKVVMTFICYLLESAEASKRIQRNDGGSKLDPGRSMAPLQRTNQQSTSDAGSLRARKPLQDMFDSGRVDLEKGFGEGSSRGRGLIES